MTEADSWQQSLPKGTAGCEALEPRWLARSPAVAAATPPRRMPGALEFRLWCFLSLYLWGNSAFNLDVAEPIVKRGEKGSFFGFSVALHQQLSPQPISW